MKILLNATLLSVLLLSGCGSNGETVASSGDDTDSPTTTEAPVSEPPTTDLAPLGAGPYPIADLTFDVAPDNAKAYTYRLACLGDTATITGDAPGVDAVGACLALNNGEVRTRVIDGVPADRMCTEIYGSADAAVIAGSLDGVEVSTEVNRHNGCGIDDWQLLAALLPPASH